MIKLSLAHLGDAFLAFFARASEKECYRVGMAFLPDRLPPALHHVDKKKSKKER